jgi:hypothetical protein
VTNFPDGVIEDITVSIVVALIRAGKSNTPLAQVGLYTLLLHFCIFILATLANISKLRRCGCSSHVVMNSSYNA